MDGAFAPTVRARSAWPESAGSRAARRMTARTILDRQHQHQRLRTALHAALLSARRQRRFAEDVAPDSAADVLALFAHGVNLRSRAGADAQQLRGTVTAAITARGP
ncbi:hypothetical protein GCM10010275_63780 [Streptomyces litmocidini]|nr:hypothetical protein GCM10010275_63780 [Streptomyces litmocidini]